MRALTNWSKMPMTSGGRTVTAASACGRVDERVQKTLKKVRVHDSNRVWPENELLKLNCGRQSRCGAMAAPRSQ